MVKGSQGMHFCNGTYIHTYVHAYIRKVTHNNQAPVQQPQTGACAVSHIWNHSPIQPTVIRIVQTFGVVHTRWYQRMVTTGLAFSVCFPIRLRVLAPVLVLGTSLIHQPNDPLWSSMWGGEEALGVPHRVVGVLHRVVGVHTHCGPACGGEKRRVGRERGDKEMRRGTSF